VVFDAEAVQPLLDRHEEPPDEGLALLGALFEFCDDVLLILRFEVFQGDVLRLEVMRSLEMFPREKWRKKSWESMNLYAQIAHKLGLYSIKSELEDIALKYLEPKD
jgi:hypothetical protein